jgi:DNA-binding NarL/FixJ family response regulator
MEAKKYGVSAMISKSADQDLLIETIEQLLAYSQPQLLQGVDTTQTNETPNASAASPAVGEINVESDPESPSELN